MAVLLVFAFVFGGASRQNELRLALVQLAALPLLIVAIPRVVARPLSLASGLAYAVLAGAALLPLLQLIPIPTGIWSSLPGRGEFEVAMAAAGISPTWLPLSLTPDRTWRSFLSLIPPLAIFLGVLLCATSTRRRLAYGLLVFGCLSIFLGTAQVASGGERLYLWATTDAGNVAGFFANRNHLATLCLMTLPFAGVLVARSVRRRGPHSGSITWVVGLYFALIIVALAVIRSRMGLALLPPTLAVSLLAAWVASGRGRPKLLLLGLGAAATAGLAFIAIFALGPILERFDSGGAREGRFENWPIVVDAADKYLPFGSGLGSFDAVFRSVEPLQSLDSTFFNQAHNDYLETWLETGWPGAALIILFLIWYARRSFSAWRGPATSERDLQRAASVAIGVVLAHSAVDYPLRTETLAVIFAMCCALLERSAKSDDDRVDEAAGDRMRTSRRRRANA